MTAHASYAISTNITKYNITKLKYINKQVLFNFPTTWNTSTKNYCMQASSGNDHVTVFSPLARVDM